jgi:hypothetical protein
MIWARSHCRAGLDPVVYAVDANVSPIVLGLHWHLDGIYICLAHVIR